MSLVRSIQESELRGACNVRKREKKCIGDLMGRSVRRRALGRQGVGIIVKWLWGKEDRSVE